MKFCQNNENIFTPYVSVSIISFTGIFKVQAQTIAGYGFNKYLLCKLATLISTVS